MPPWRTIDFNRVRDAVNEIIADEPPGSPLAAVRLNWMGGDVSVLIPGADRPTIVWSTRLNATREGGRGWVAIEAAGILRRIREAIEKNAAAVEAHAARFDEVFGDGRLRRVANEMLELERRLLDDDMRREPRDALRRLAEFISPRLPALGASLYDGADALDALDRIRHSAERPGAIDRIREGSK